MRKLYILRPIKDWDPWYDKAFGFIVMAKDAVEARWLVANSLERGDEDNHDSGGVKSVWMNAKLTSCKQLKTTGGKKIIMRDFNAA